MYTCFYVKYTLFLLDFNGTLISWTDVRKYSNIKFHENPPGGSRVVPCEQTGGQTDRQTDRNDEANTVFSQFCERAQKLTEFHLVSYSLIN